MQKQYLIAILTLVAIGAILFNIQKEVSSIQAQFQAWKAQYNKMGDLSSQENAYRMNIFQQNLLQIEDHNSNKEKTYQMGVNQFSAYTQSQFETIYLSSFVSEQIQVSDEKLNKFKVEIDWVSKGAVRPVRNEGKCTGSYAFSAIGAIEGNAFVYHQISKDYSVQQLIDCSTTYGNQGCNTGYMTNCFQYIRSKGLSTEDEYPFRENYGSCRHDFGSFKIGGFTNIVSCNEMESALNERPLSVAVDGSYFRNYHSGVFSNCSTRLNLAVLLVGMTETYYRLKNSWGVNWGEAGYIRLTRGFNVCGICSAVSYPTPAN